MYLIDLKAASKTCSSNSAGIRKPARESWRSSSNGTMRALLSLSIDLRAGGVDRDMLRIRYVPPGDSGIAESKGSCCGSSHGVTLEIGDKGDSLLRLEATSFVAAPKTDSSLE